MKHYSVQSELPQNEQFFPKVVSKKVMADSAFVTLEIPGKLEFFKGHFKGFPILPGVVQLDWVYKFAQFFFHLQIPGELEIPKVKFSRPIYPGTILGLELQLRSEKTELFFLYKDASTTCSTGVLSFKS